MLSLMFVEGNEDEEAIEDEMVRGKLIYTAYNPGLLTDIAKGQL